MSPEAGTFEAWALEFETCAPRASGQLELYLDSPTDVAPTLEDVQKATQAALLELEGKR